MQKCKVVWNAPATNEAFSDVLSSDMMWSMSSCAIVKSVLANLPRGKQQVANKPRRNLRIDKNNKEMRSSSRFIYRSYVYSYRQLDA